MAISDNHEYMILGHKRIEDTVLGVVFLLDTHLEVFTDEESEGNGTYRKLPNLKLVHSKSTVRIVLDQQRSQGCLIPGTMTIS